MTNNFCEKGDMISMEIKKDTINIPILDVLTNLSNIVKLKKREELKEHIKQYDDQNYNFIVTKK